MLVVDCQSDLLRDLQSRFVIPLFETSEIGISAPRLNPAFDIDGRSYRLFPQGAATLPVRELQNCRTNLSGDDFAILAAIDALVSGT